MVDVDPHGARRRRAGPADHDEVGDGRLEPLAVDADLRCPSLHGGDDALRGRAGRGRGRRSRAGWPAALRRQQRAGVAGVAPSRTRPATASSAARASARRCAGLAGREAARSCDAAAAGDESRRGGGVGERAGLGARVLDDAIDLALRVAQALLQRIVGLALGTLLAFLDRVVARPQVVLDRRERRAASAPRRGARGRAPADPGRRAPGARRPATLGGAEPARRGDDRRRQARGARPSRGPGCAPGDP